MLLKKPPPFTGKRLTTLNEVDEALSLAADARKISERKFLDQLGSFWLDFRPISGDPWSLPYRKHWWSAYEHIAGKPYEINNEDFIFDVDYYVNHPYPFCTQDYHVVSQQLIGIGSIIQALALPPKSTILEMGAGWGNTSLFFAQMGYDVTALDINERYGELINKRAKALNVDVDFKCMPFDDAVKMGRKFDCVLFFESFHHAYDHLQLLDSIPSLLEPRGCLALAGEPLNENLPFEWGINTAGEALWQIRTHGWFELVFRESYLTSTLQRKGFSVKASGMQGNLVGTTLICHVL